MRNLILQLPETGGLVDPTTEGYAKLLNIELDNLRRDLNRHVANLVSVEVSDDYSVVAADEVVLCDGEITITLPIANSSGGKNYFIKNIGSSTVTLTGSETIDEEDTQDLYQYETVHVVSDGTEWWII